MASADKKRDHLAAILRDLLKVIKVVSLYPEENPLPLMLKRSFAERLIQLVEDYGHIDFAIERERLLFEAEPIFTDKSREEALAGLFFSAGLTRISFSSQLTFDEIQKFLALIKAYLNSGEQSGDLVSMLWEAHFIGIAFEVVEDLSLDSYKGDVAAHAARFGVRLHGHKAASEPELFSTLFGAKELDGGSGGVRSHSQSDAIRMNNHTQGEYVTLGLTETHSGHTESDDQSDTGPVDGHYIEDGALIELPADLLGGPNEVSSGEVRSAFKAMGLDMLPEGATRPKPDMKLILNSEWQVSGEDEERIRTIISTDTYFDQYESTAELCKEMLLQESQMQDFYEVVDICDKVLGELVAAGQFSFASSLLRYLYDLDARIRPQRPLWAEKMKECCFKQSGAERLRAVADAANAKPDLPAPELRRYLDLACAHQFMFLTELVGRLHHPAHAQSVSDLLVLRGRENIHVVAKGLRSSSIETICESIGILGRIGDAAVFGQLETVRSHPDPRVRRELVRWVATASDSRAVQFLSEYLFDADESVRSAALSAFLDRKENVIGAMELVINDKRYQSMESKPKQQLLNAYARKGGETAVHVLEVMTTQGGLFATAAIDRQRAAAFEALAHNDSPLAEQYLLKCARSWRAQVREHANRALSRRREILYANK